MGATDERIGIRELRQHASRYLEQVEQGSSFEITRHGRPVARLVPARPAAGRLAELVAEGVMQLAEDAGDLLDVVPAPAGPPGEPTASEELRRMRDEERW